MIHHYGDFERDRFGVNKSLLKAVKGFERRYGNPSPPQNPDKTHKGPVVVVRVANGGMTPPETLVFGDVEPKDLLPIISHLRVGPQRHEFDAKLMTISPSTGEVKHVKSIPFAACGNT